MSNHMAFGLDDPSPEEIGFIAKAVAKRTKKPDDPPRRVKKRERDLPEPRKKPEDKIEKMEPVRVMEGSPRSRSL